MKKFRIAALLASAPLAAHAQTYTPVPMSSLAAQVAPIIASQNYAGVHIDQALLGSVALSQVYADQQGQISSNAASVQAAQTTANAAIPMSQRGAASGVAPLDVNSNLINTVRSPAITGAPVTSAGQQALFNTGRFPIVSDVGAASDPFQSPDSVMIGGQPTQGWNATTGAFNNTQGRPGSLVITGQPWGPYNAGAIESILWGTSVNQQNGIAATDWRQGAGYIPGSDAVAQYIGVGDTPAFAMGTVDHFDSGDVVLKAPLTTAQIAMLRVGMYIQTNIIDTTTTNSGMVSNGSGGYVARTSAPTNSAGETTLPTQDWYRGIISGWSADGSTIRVSCWENVSASNKTCVVPGAATTDVTDAYWTQWGQPMVFIGAASDGSAHNEYLYYDGSKSTGQGTNLSHSMLSDEIDLRYSATRENEVGLNGISISVAAMPGTQVGRNALTRDSYMLAMSGDIHNDLIIDNAADANVFDSHSFYLHGQEGVDLYNGNTRAQSTLFGFTGLVDEGNSMSLMGWLKHDATTSTGSPGASFHLSLNNGGYAKTLDPSQNGLGEIVWNRAATNYGGISFCGSSGNCLDVAPSGAVTANEVLTALNGMSVTGNLALTGSLISSQPAAVANTGVTGGNGFTIGAQPNGYAALLGAYAETGDTNTLVDVEVGGIAKFTVAPTGDGTFAGDINAQGTIKTQGEIVSGNNMTVGQGANLIILPPTASGATTYPVLNAPDGYTFHASTSAGGDASLSAFNVTASGIFKEPLLTPSSSTATCNAGQFTDDANYHYVCVAMNTWKRVALSNDTW